MKRKNLSTLLAITMVATLFVGCGNTVSSTNAEVYEVIDAEAEEVIENVEQEVESEISSDYTIYENGAELSQTSESSPVETTVENKVFIHNNYLMTDFQVPTDQIIKDNNKECYTQLTLLSHEVTAPENIDSSVSASDTIQMYAELKNPHGYFEMSKIFRRNYWYWGVENGWLPNTEIIDEWNADISGFSNTYWKLEKGADENFYVNSLFDIEGDLYADDIEVYLHFGEIYTPEIDWRNHNNEWELFVAMTGGEIALKSDTDFKVMPLELQDVSQHNSYASVTLSETGQIGFKLYAPETGKDADVGYWLKLENGIGDLYIQGAWLQPTTEEEYTRFIQ